MFNQIVIIGRLGFDPTTKSTKSGTKMCQFKVAVNVGWVQSKTTDWYNVSVFGKLADTCQSRLSKGDLVCACGTLQLRTFDGKDGQKKFSLEITANDVSFLSPKKNSQEQQPAQQSQSADSFSYETSTEEQFEIDNNIPF